MNNAITPESAQIRCLNNLLRKELIGGKVVFAGRLASIRGAEGIALQHRVLASVRLAEVDPDNDPYSEGHFGKVTVEGKDFYWKIDYYDLDLEFASEDPTDPKRTIRVMSLCRRLLTPDLRDHHAWTAPHRQAVQTNAASSTHFLSPPWP